MRQIYNRRVRAKFVHTKSELYASSTKKWTNITANWKKKKKIDKILFII